VKKRVITHESLAPSLWRENRPPRRHIDCACCGVGGDGIRVCGVCREAGIDGPVIRGTTRAQATPKK